LAGGAMLLLSVLRCGFLKTASCGPAEATSDR
jgi:hypothetical protein